MDRETARRLLDAERSLADDVEQQQRAVLDAGHDELFDELTTVDQHEADAASEVYEREQALTILQLAQERRANIDHALAKIRSGDYGRCETCGDTISDERLEAVPDARFCELHQRDWELGRLGLAVGPLPRASADVADPGWRELDLLPDDDEPKPRREPRTAEEAAMHVEWEPQPDRPDPC